MGDVKQCTGSHLQQQPPNTLPALAALISPLHHKYKYTSAQIQLQKKSNTIQAKTAQISPLHNNATTQIQLHQYPKYK